MKLEEKKKRLIKMKLKEYYEIGRERKMKEIEIWRKIMRLEWKEKRKRNFN